MLSILTDFRMGSLVSTKANIVMVFSSKTLTCIINVNGFVSILTLFIKHSLLRFGSKISQLERMDEDAAFVSITCSFKLHSYAPLELLGLHSGINQFAHASCIRDSFDQLFLIW